MPLSSLSNLLEQWTVCDENFSTAYEQVGDLQRSWLKKSIATSFTLAGSPESTVNLLEKKWPDGFCAQTRTTSCDWVLVCLGADFISPVQLCAALIPPLLAGVKEVAVLREDDGQPFPSTLLTACELSGWETVCQLPKKELLKLVDIQQKTGGSGRILDFGLQELQHTSPYVQQNIFWQAPSHLRAGIVFSEALEWNTTLLDWAHPGMLFHYWGVPEKKSSLLLKSDQSTPEKFHGDVLFAPPHLLRGQTMLGLAPGQELSWYWSQLLPSFFYNSRLSLFS